MYTYDTKQEFLTENFSDNQREKSITAQIGAAKIHCEGKGYAVKMMNIPIT
jgi:hypothetical protein